MMSVVNSGGYTSLVHRVSFAFAFAFAFVYLFTLFKYCCDCVSDGRSKSERKKADLFLQSTTHYGPTCSYRDICGPTRAGRG